MGCSRGVVAPAKIACRIPAGNCNETFLPAIVPKVSNFKGNSGKGFRRRDISQGSLRSVTGIVKFIRGLTIRPESACS